MSEAALDSLEKMVNEMMRENFAPAKKEKEKAAKRVAMLEEKMDRLIGLRLTGGIPRPKYETKKAEIETQLMMARIRYADFDAEKVDLITEFDRARQFLMDSGGYWRTASALEKQMTFQLFFEGPISVNWKDTKVGTVALTVPTCAIWYTRRDSNSRPPV